MVEFNPGKVKTLSHLFYEQLQNMTEHYTRVHLTRYNIYAFIF